MKIDLEKWQTLLVTPKIDELFEKSKCVDKLLLLFTEIQAKNEFYCHIFWKFYRFKLLIFQLWVGQPGNFCKNPFR